MAISRHGLQRGYIKQDRQLEGEGVLRTLLLSFAVVLPLLSLIYLQIHDTRLGYEMKEIQDRIRKEEELARALELERSRLSRPEIVQQWAGRAGFVPAKSTNLVRRPFTQDDQRMAKLKLVSSS